jgi:hypothetical protein
MLLLSQGPETQSPVAPAASRDFGGGHQKTEANLKRRGDTMSKHKLFAIFALGCAFALTAALPASAKGHRGSSTPTATTPAPTAQAIFGTSNPGGITVHLRRTPQASGRPSFMLKSYCEGTCSNGTGFWCSGDSATCVDGSGCTASGGGLTVTVTCNAS